MRTFASARMTRLVAAGITAGLVLSRLPAWGSVLHGPMVQGGTTTNVYVLAECSVGAGTPMTVNYGTTTAYGSSASTLTTRTTDLPSYVHVIKLTGLQPNTLYHYQLTGQGTTPADYTFQTAVQAGTPFRFCWSCDYRNGTAVHGQLAQSVLYSNTVPNPPIFYLTAGDYASDNSYSTWISQWTIPAEMTTEANMVTYYGVGNHDVINTENQMKAFEQPPDSSAGAGNLYYSFDCGDLHVTMGDFETSYASGSAQYNWIQQDLQASLKPWKLFADHAPAYTYGGSGAHSGDSDWQTVTVNLLQPNGVKLFFAGHNHFYQRNVINGIQHVTCGGGGAPLYSVSTGSGTVVSVSDNCYVVADVSPTNFHARAYNNVGAKLDEFTLVKLPAPLNLAAAPGNGQVLLFWDAVAGASSYTVWYGTASGGPYSTSKSATAASTTVTGLANGTTYYFVTTATDTNGPSAISAQVSAVPTGVPDTQPPSVPTGLAAAALSSSAIALSWNASTDNVAVAGYYVYRAGTNIATTSATNYTNTGLAASTLYTYTVAAFDAATNLSAASSPASATTWAPDTQPPSVPTGLTATALSSSAIALAWNASTDNVAVAGYYVYRSGTNIATVTTTAYTNTGLAASTLYTYTVAAFDATINISAPSSPASATALAVAPVLVGESFAYTADANLNGLTGGTGWGGPWSVGYNASWPATIQSGNLGSYPGLVYDGNLLEFWTRGNGSTYETLNRSFAAPIADQGQTVWFAMLLGLCNAKDPATWTLAGLTTDAGGATNATLFTTTANGSPTPFKFGSTTLFTGDANWTPHLVLLRIQMSGDANPETLTAYVDPNLANNPSTWSGVTNRSLYANSGLTGFSYGGVRNSTSSTNTQFYMDEIRLAGTWQAAVGQSGQITNVSPVVSNWGMLSNRSFTLGGTASAGQSCVLLTASNLAPPTAWTPVATNIANSSGAFSLTDPQATNLQRRFYRVRSP